MAKSSRALKLLQLSSSLAAATVATLTWLTFKDAPAPIAPAEAPDAPVVSSVPVLPTRARVVVPPRSSVHQILLNHSLDRVTAHRLVEAARTAAKKLGARSLAQVRAGEAIELHWLPGPVRLPVRVDFPFTPEKTLIVERGPADDWNARVRDGEVRMERAGFTGVVNTSLWESAEEGGVNPSVISDLAEVFAWQVDFLREVRPGDRWRLVVERKWIDGKEAGWGGILAAEYVSSGKTYTAVRYNTEYYAPDGSSLKMMFRKSPMKFARISSRFQRARFHPVLRIRRPHRGVDYAAPPGTPIMSVGAGTITFAAWNGDSGKMVRIRHNSTYQTVYKHLSGFRSGLRNGSRVGQGEVIGYVGSTGLSTGPHLHFEFLENGRHVNPLGRKFPSAEPVRRDLMPEFSTVAQQLIAALPSWRDGAVALQAER